MLNNMCTGITKNEFKRLRTPLDYHDGIIPTQLYEVDGAQGNLMV